MPAKEKKKKEKKPAKGKEKKVKKAKGTSSAKKGKEEVDFFEAGTGQTVGKAGAKKKYSLFDTSAMDSRFSLGGKPMNFAGMDAQAAADGFGAGAKMQGEKKSKIWEALNPQQLHKLTAKEKRQRNDDDNVMVMEVRGGGGMGALAAEDMQLERDEEGNIIDESTRVESDESDFGDDDLADFDPETMDDLTRKRMERAKEAEEKRKALKKVHLAKKAKEQVGIDKQLKEIAKAKAKEEKDASNKIDAKNVDALAELDFGFGDAGMESDE